MVRIGEIMGMEGLKVAGEVWDTLSVKKLDIS